MRGGNEMQLVGAGTAPHCVLLQGPLETTDDFREG